MIFQFLLFISSVVFGSTADLSTEALVQKAERDSIATETVMSSRNFLWQTGWNAFSLDRISYRTNSGLYGYYGPQPAYVLDGIPFDPKMFDMTYPQLMPVSYKQIREISVRQGAGVHQGVEYASGLMMMHSVPLKNGFSVHASGQLGHNSGEPGPWVFDPSQVTPNIDRFGHWADAGASLKFGKWYAKSFFRTYSFLNMNPFVQTRIRNLLALPELGEWPDGRATTNLGLAETGIKSNRLHLRMQGIRSESEEFLYFQPLAREIPTDFTMEQLSVAGSVSLSDLFGIRTMFQYREKATQYRRNRLEEELDWSQGQNIGRASIYLDTDKFQFDTGTEYREVDTKASGLTSGAQQYINFFLNQQVDITPGVRFGSYAAVTVHEDERPLRGTAFFEFDITGEWTATFEGSYSELLPEISNPVDEWIIRGYDILERLDIYAFIPQDISHTRLVTFSNKHKYELSNRIHAGLDIRYLNFLNFHVPFQDAKYDLEYSTLPGGYFLFTDTSGERLNIFLDATVNWSASFQQSIGVYWSKTLSGDTAYSNYWKTIPEYLVQQSSVFTPYPDLELGVNMQFQTETVWDEFRRLDGRLNRSFNIQFPYRIFSFRNRIPTAFNMELTLAKWMWEQRIRIVFALSNLFNQKHQTHPIGAREDLGYMFRLELRL